LFAIPGKYLHLLAFFATLLQGEKPILSRNFSMPNLQQLLDNAAITVSELSRRANVDYRTARKAVEGTGPVQRVKVLALLRVINELLGTSYRPEDIDDLEID
jgi:predicted transcriptional regulator